MFNNSFIRNKVGKAVNRHRKSCQSMCTHTSSTCKSLWVYGLTACVYDGRGRGFFHLGPRKTSSRKLWFKVGQNWLQDGKGNKWNSHEKGSQDQGVAHFKAAFSIGIWEWTKPSKNDSKKKNQFSQGRHITSIILKAQDTNWFITCNECFKFSSDLILRWHPSREGLDWSVKMSTEVGSKTGWLNWDTVVKGLLWP